MEYTQAEIDWGYYCFAHDYIYPQLGTHRGAQLLFKVPADIMPDEWGSYRQAAEAGIPVEDIFA